MSSPFLGMDQYLEGELWQEFHDTLAHELRAQLLSSLPDKYITLLAKRYIYDRPALSVLDLPQEQRILYPDVHVGKIREAADTYQVATTAVPTVELGSPMDEEIPILSLEIQDVAKRRLVTVLEILSPVNKRGDDARQYNERRQDLMHTRTHLLEIDLIRRCSRIPLEGHLPPAANYIYLSRFNRRPKTEVWAVTLREPLPVVPVPLLPPDEDVPLDLQSAINACFSLVRYDCLLNYQDPPPPPEFSAADATWITNQILAREKSES